MITREDVHELAEFEAVRGEECAVSFYFQPGTPQNKSHREEAILAKDLVRDASKEAEKLGKNGSVRRDLDRILLLAASLHGQQKRAKAVFACEARKFWREFDLPPLLPGSRIVVNRRFHLTPLAAMLGAQAKVCVVLLDRQRARFFDLRLDQLTERSGIANPLTRRGRSDGFGGYDAGHAERRTHDEALHHFKDVAARLKQDIDNGVWEQLIIGALDTNWRDFEWCLHPYVGQRVIGHFSGEVASMTLDEVKEQAQAILRGSLVRRRDDLVKEVLSHAKGHKLGVTGLRRVLRSLELGEVQVLLIGENYVARAVECLNCGHIDSHLVQFCSACGRATRELENVCEAIVPAAVRRDIELLYVSDGDLDKVGNIAALLRFRADRVRAPAMPVAS